ncbi:MAG: efflux RND transporter periplasmic adaptor subunit [Pedosphaera sp.]|nr:efflux RND transporter periplasmic adaptor subunit [Pedosphaera sp.]
MNEEKLQHLRIASDQKRRAGAPIWTIVLGIAAVTGVAIFFAIPRASDSVRSGLKSNRELARASDKGAPDSNRSAPAAQGAAMASQPAKTEGSVLTASGYIVNRERIELSPRFMGVVKWIGVKKGDSVTNGQVVVLLDDAEYKARLKESEGRLAYAKAGLSKAELDYDRVAKLALEKVESKQAEDDVRVRVESARASLLESQGQNELAKTFLDWTVIRSPIDGVVLEKLVDPNELVVPQSFGGTRGPSTALIALADPKDLQVEIDLNESDLSKIFLNQVCRVSPEAYPQKGYEGYVAEIAPEASRQKGTLQLKVQIRNPDRFLTPELSAKVDFIGVSHEQK